MIHKDQDFQSKIIIKDRRQQKKADKRSLACMPSMETCGGYFSFYDALYGRGGRVFLYISYTDGYVSLCQKGMVFGQFSLG